MKKQTEGLEGDAKTKKIYQLYMKKYLRSVKGVDDNVGRILDYLDESGLGENTIVMYTSDQGFFLGEHGLYDKRFMYEEALRMPLLVRWPKEVEKKTVSDGMILNVDFAPTIMEVAGLELQPEMQGRSFLPILMGNQPADWRDSMYYRYYQSHFDTEPHYGVRTYEHKLIYYKRIDQWELYDLEKDPTEMNNLYGDPEYQQVADRLKRELNRLQKELEDDPQNDGSNPSLGQLAPDPLYVSDKLPFGSGDISILMRFKSKGGGTLFSQTNLDANPFTESAWEGDKTLYIQDSNLILSDSGHDMLIEKDIGDNRWYSLAVVTQNSQTRIYLDGELEVKAGHTLSTNKPGQTFNIGAGLSGNGYHGYNFLGSIAHILAIDKVLSYEAIKAHADEELPESEGNILINWQN